MWWVGLALAAEPCDLANATYVVDASHADPRIRFDATGATARYAVGPNSFALSCAGGVCIGGGREVRIRDLGGATCGIELTDSKIARPAVLRPAHIDALWDDCPAGRETLDVVGNARSLFLVEPDEPASCPSTYAAYVDGLASTITVSPSTGADKYPLLTLSPVTEDRHTIHLVRVDTCSGKAPLTLVSCMAWLPHGGDVGGLPVGGLSEDMSRGIGGLIGSGGVEIGGGTPTVGPGGDPVIVGALDRQAIDEVIGRHTNQIRYCYQRELTMDPKLGGGQLIAAFTIGGDGTVKAASIQTSKLSSDALHTCVVGRLQKMSFPRPSDGKKVTVAYPFLFAP